MESGKPAIFELREYQNLCSGTVNHVKLLILRLLRTAPGTVVGRTLTGRPPRTCGLVGRTGSVRTVTVTNVITNGNKCREGSSELLGPWEQAPYHLRGEGKLPGKALLRLGADAPTGSKGDISDPKHSAVGGLWRVAAWSWESRKAAGTAVPEKTKLSTKTGEPALDRLGGASGSGEGLCSLLGGSR